MTLDSCRFDTAARARTPFLDSIGSLRRAITYGTFTLPAHIAFFSGFLPNVTELPLLDFYSRERFQLWRLARARHREKQDQLQMLQGDTVLDGFRRRGHRIIGAGGVRWFSSGILPNLFDQFHYWAPVDDDTNPFPFRRRDSLALLNTAEITEAVLRHRRWFLFVNAAETHAPYTVADSRDNRELHEVLDRALPLWNGKVSQSLETIIKPEEFALMHRAQIEAMETVDARLGELFSILPRPFAAVVCADHGEAFGENGLWGHDFVDDSVLHVPIWISLVDL